MNINLYDMAIGKNQFIPLKNGIEKVSPRDAWRPSEVDSFRVAGCTKSAKSLVIHYYRQGVRVIGEVKRMIFAKDCCADDHGGVYININGNKYRVGRWECV